MCSRCSQLPRRKSAWAPAGRRGGSRGEVCKLNRACYWEARATVPVTASQGEWQPAELLHHKPWSTMDTPTHNSNTVVSYQLFMIVIVGKQLWINYSRQVVLWSVNVARWESYFLVQSRWVILQEETIRPLVSAMRPPISRSNLWNYNNFKNTIVLLFQRI